MATSDSVLLGLFFAFSQAGQVVLTMCLITAAVSRLSRDMALVNAAVAMIIFSTACLLLLYADEYHGAPPRFSLCLAQACLIYGSLAMSATSVFCLFFQLWHSLRTTLNRKAAFPKVVRQLLRVLPWLAFCGMLLASLTDGLHDKRQVTRSRDFFYCSASARVGYASLCICGGFMMASVVLEAHIGYMLYYGWRARTLRREVLQIDSIVRLGIFSIYGLMCVVVTIVLLQFPNRSSPRYPFIFMSTLPLAVWLVFWTQKDVLRVWTCRKTRISAAQQYDEEGPRLDSSQMNLTLREMRVQSSWETARV